jgi:nitrate/TMAO reductase-like tetraheme cytochrome c subunit
MSADTEKPTRPLWMKLLGLRRRDGKYVRIAPSRWGWVLILFIGFIGGSLAFAEYSMQPDFCRSCHLMEPYYQAWHQSTHRGVSCPECHFEPGLENTLYGKFQASSQAVKYITNTYGSKPHAEIKDSSCMRSGCHEQRVLEGKVNWEVPTVRGGKITIKFDHTPHLKEERRGKQLRCVSCHSQIVQGQHLVVTLDTCFLCHMKGVEHGRHEQTLGGCQSCHEAPKEQIRLATGMFNHGDYLSRGVSCENCHAEIVKGDGAVPKQVCWTCHNQEKQVQRYNEPKFLHQTHVTDHKVECQNCHIHIEHSLSAATKPDVKTPVSTHAMLEAGSCASCHEKTHGGPSELYRGTGARGIPDMPSPMYRAQVDCIACHKSMKEPNEAASVVGQTFVAVQESCNYCHGAKYDTVLDTWRGIITNALKKTQDEYDIALAQVNASNVAPMEKLRAQRLLDDAIHNIRLVKLGHGVHNVNYATAALNVAQENARQARAIVGAGAGP